ASLAADTHFGHGGLIIIGIRIIMLAQAGIVAGAAHRIPGHAAARPMAPFAWPPILAAINIEPIISMRIVSQLSALISAARSCYEKLAQRIDSDHTLGFEGVALSIQSS